MFVSVKVLFYVVSACGFVMDNGLVLIASMMNDPVELILYKNCIRVTFYTLTLPQHLCLSAAFWNECGDISNSAAIVPFRVVN